MRLVHAIAGAAVMAAAGAGCGGAQLPASPGIALGAAGSGTRALTEHSWMSPRARRGDLLYVSDTGGRVYVYSYPQGELVGTLVGFRGPQGVCSDAAGDVYVIDTPAVAISKFARGGTKPIAVLHVFGYYPEGCAVDSATGDLAVADYAGNPYLGPGAITIFRKGKGMGKSYQDPNVNQFYFCSYDAKGNLYADGTNAVTTQAELAEIPRGGTSFTDIMLDANLGPYPLGIQWDGKYVALQTWKRVLYRIDVRGSKGHIVQTTRFQGDHSNLVSQFTIAGRTIVIPYGTAKRLVHKIGLWPYPAGGRATATFAPPPHVAELFSTALTVAPK